MQFQLSLENSISMKWAIEYTEPYLTLLFYHGYFVVCGVWTRFCRGENKTTSHSSLDIFTGLVSLLPSSYIRQHLSECVGSPSQASTTWIRFLAQFQQDVGYSWSGSVSQARPRGGLTWFLTCSVARRMSWVVVATWPWHWVLWWRHHDNWDTLPWNRALREHVLWCPWPAPPDR